MYVGKARADDLVLFLQIPDGPTHLVQLLDDLAELGCEPLLHITGNGALALGNSCELQPPSCYPHGCHHRRGGRHPLPVAGAELLAPSLRAPPREPRLLVCTIRINDGP